MALSVQKNGQDPFNRNFIFPRPCREFLDILDKFFSTVIHFAFKMVKLQDWIRKEKNNKIKLIHKKNFNISQNDVTGVKDTKQLTKFH